MPKIFPVVVKRTTVVVESGAANAIWSEEAALSDPTMNEQVFTGERVDLTDEAVESALIVDVQADVSDDSVVDTEADWSCGTDMGEGRFLDHTVVNDGLDGSDTFQAEFDPKVTFQVSEAGKNLDLPLPEELDASELLIVDVAQYPVDRDAYVDQASAGTNFGTATALKAKGKSSLANDEQRIYIAFDLTKFADLEGNPTVPNGMSICLVANGTGSLGAANVTTSYDIRSGGTAPFTENTLNWNNQPTYGTSRQTGTFTAPSALGAVFLAVNTAETTTILNDGWMLLVLTTAGGVSPSTCTVQSKETARPPYVHLLLAR